MKKRSEEVEELLSCLDSVTSQVSRDTTNLNEALESSASQSESRIEAFIQKCVENRVCMYKRAIDKLIFFRFCLRHNMKSETVQEPIRKVTQFSLCGNEHIRYHANV